MSRRHREHIKTMFESSAALNNHTYLQYVRRLTELSISMFEWKNLPDTVDSRYLELKLFERGCTVFFEDDIIGYLCLECLNQGRFDVYGEPLIRRAFSGYNNYQKMLKKNNSVIIWNNFTRTNSILDVEMYSRRLYNLDRIIDVNANAQKTPVLLQCDEKQRLTLLNLYKEFDGNAPIIFGDKNLDLNALKSINTNAPYVADKINELKVITWNEALTHLGISNVSLQKKERLITDEVTRNQGATIASRYTRLEPRRLAAEKINKMFGLNIEVNYREDYQLVENETVYGHDTTESKQGTETTGEFGNE